MKIYIHNGKQRKVVVVANNKMKAINIISKIEYYSML